MDESDGSECSCVVEAGAGTLSFVIGTVRRTVSAAELHAIWRRFGEWTVRAEGTDDFAGFFQDLNRWGIDGRMVFRKTAALLLCAKALLLEADKMRFEEFWERLRGRLPLRREFAGQGGCGGYAVTFSRVGESLLFEKNGCAVPLGVGEIQRVWHRFVDWWCLPEKVRADDCTKLDIGGQLGGEAGFYAFELACLMNEMEHLQVFGGGC